MRINDFADRLGLWIKPNYIEAPFAKKWGGAFCVPIFFKILEWFLRFTGKNKETLYAYYDLATTSPTYDIANFMPLAELARISTGCKDMVVVIVPATNTKDTREAAREQNGISEKENNQWRLDHIVKPITKLYKNCRGVMVCGKRWEARSLLYNFSKYTYPRRISLLVPEKNNYWIAVEKEHKKGSKIPCWEASEISKKLIKLWLCSRNISQKFVVLTFREATYNTARNSKIEEWEKVSQRLIKLGYDVVIVRDAEATYDSLVGFQGCHFCTDAVWNIALRAALYELAYMNMMVSHGPSMLCETNSRCRYLMFKIVVEECFISREEHLRLARGLNLGDNPCTATRFQKYVWEDDQNDVIMREFSEMSKKIEESQ